MTIKKKIVFTEEMDIELLREMINNHPYAPPWQLWREISRNVSRAIDVETG